MDRLEAMSLLLRVVDDGSFSLASRSLRVPLATVSRKVSELETHLGAKLLIRTTRKLALTEAGADYVASARRILEQVNEAERTVAGEFQTPRGELILTAPILFGRLHVLPIVVEYLATYPEIDVRLLFSDRNVDLIDEHVDMAVRIGQLPDSGMVATRIGSMRMVVCASQKVLAAHGTPGAPGDLARLPCVNFVSSPVAPKWLFQLSASEVAEVPIRPRLSVSTAEAAVWAAIRGVGATRVLHYQCAEAVHKGELQIILADFEPQPLPVHLMHAERGALPLKMRTFLDFAATRLRASLARLGSGVAENATASRGSVSASSPA